MCRFALKATGENMKIESYSFGFIKINDAEYKSDVIVFPDRISGDWWRKNGHSLVMEDMRGIMDFSPDVLVIGTGAYGLMDVPAATRETLEKAGIEVLEAKTAEACRMYNSFIADGRKVVGDRNHQ